MSASKIASSPGSPTSPNTSRDKSKDEPKLLDKLGTIGRKKKAKEAQEFSEETKTFPELGAGTTPMAANTGPPEVFLMEDGEERHVIEKASRDDPKLKQLIQVLIDWINDELADHRIIIKDIEEDLYDGQVLQKLVEKLAKIKIEVPEVTQSEIVQRSKLKVVLEIISHILNLPPQCTTQRWDVPNIHNKNLVPILHLLVALVRHFRAPVKLPEFVSVAVSVVTKAQGQLMSRKITEDITGAHDDIGSKFERDAFDTLFDHAPEKLGLVKKSLLSFVKKHLDKVNLEVKDLDSQFQDGIYMCMLMGLLEGYFIPLHSYHLTPTTDEQKVHNVTLAFELMDDAGLPRPRARPEDIVNGELKSTLRVLYNLFTRYKSIS